MTATASRCTPPPHHPARLPCIPATNWAVVQVLQRCTRHACSRHLYRLQFNMCSTAVCSCCVRPTLCCARDMLPLLLLPCARLCCRLRCLLFAARVCCMTTNPPGSKPYTPPPAFPPPPPPQTLHPTVSFNPPHPLPPPHVARAAAQRRVIATQSQLSFVFSLAKEKLLLLQQHQALNHKPWPPNNKSANSKP